MNGEPVENRGAGAVLKNINFRKLWLGQTISQIGDGLTNLALLIVVTQLTGSTVALAGVAIALALPQLLFGLGAGVIVDRVDRKRVMIVSDIVRALIVLGLVVVREPSQIWIFYILAFLQATVGTFFDPAKTALIPAIVEEQDLLAANSLSQTTRVATGVLGAALAGVLVGLTGNGTIAFGLDALSFLLSALFIWRIAVPAGVKMTPEPRTDGALSQLTEGLNFVRHNALVGTAILTFAVTMLGLGAVNVLFVPYTLNILHVPVTAVGFLDAAQVVGMVVGSVMVAAIAARLSIKQLIAGGVFALGVLIALFGAVQDVLPVLVLTLLVGLVISPVQAAVATLMQREVPNEMRGRVSSAAGTLITLTNVISMAFAGALGETLGIRQVFYLSGGIVIAAALLAMVLLRDPGAKEMPAQVEV